ncbi:MAG: hypothetical protein SGPRY_003838 [Prymnesium sp.]
MAALSLDSSFPDAAGERASARCSSRRQGACVRAAQSLLAQLLGPPFHRSFPAITPTEREQARALVQRLLEQPSPATDRAGRLQRNVHALPRWDCRYGVSPEASASPLDSCSSHQSRSDPACNAAEAQALDGTSWPCPPECNGCSLPQQSLAPAGDRRGHPIRIPEPSSAGGAWVLTDDELDERFDPATPHSDPCSALAKTKDRSSRAAFGSAAPRFSLDREPIAAHNATREAEHAKLTSCKTGARSGEAYRSPLATTRGCVKSLTTPPSSPDTIEASPSSERKEARPRAPLGNIGTLTIDHHACESVGEASCLAQLEEREKRGGGVLVDDPNKRVDANVLAALLLRRAGEKGEGSTLLVASAREVSAWEERLLGLCVPFALHHGKARLHGRVPRDSLAGKVVLTTYGMIVARETLLPKETNDGTEGLHLPACVASPQLHRYKWRRVIFAESECLSNAKTQRAAAALALCSDVRWALMKSGSRPETVGKSEPEIKLSLTHSFRIGLVAVKKLISVLA